MLTKDDDCVVVSQLLLATLGRTTSLKAPRLAIPQHAATVRRLQALTAVPTRNTLLTPFRTLPLHSALSALHGPLRMTGSGVGLAASSAPPRSPQPIELVRRRERLLSSSEWQPQQW